MILQCDTFDTFSVDFKKLIGVALAIWGKIEPALYFEDTKKEFFLRESKSYQLSLFPWTTEEGI